MARRAYHSFRRDISPLIVSALERLSICADRCRPRDWASRHVNPSRAQEASAFMSLSSTKPVMSMACMESRLGLEGVSHQDGQGIHETTDRNKKFPRRRK